jgi:hypothetical protein
MHSSLVRRASLLLPSHSFIHSFIYQSPPIRNAGRSTGEAARSACVGCVRPLFCREVLAAPCNKGGNPNLRSSKARPSSPHPALSRSSARVFRPGKVQTLKRCGACEGERDRQRRRAPFPLSRALPRRMQQVVAQIIWAIDYYAVFYLSYLDI